MDETDNNKDYQRFLKKVTKKPKGSVDIGTVLRYDFRFLFKKFTNIYAVTQHCPPSLMSYESTKESEIQATGTNFFIKIDSTTTKLTMTFAPEISGYFENKSDKKVNSIYNSTLTKVLKKIKKNVER